MKTTTAKREKIYLDFQIENYNLARNGATEKMKPLNEAIEELATITKKPVSDIQALSNDILGYSMETIKQTFPKPFELGLGDDATLKMLSIDLSKLNECAKHWDKNTKYEISDNYAYIEVNQEDFNLYVETDEQFERYDFAMQCIETIEKAVKYTAWLRKQDLASYYKYFIEYSFDLEGKVKLRVRNSFVLTGN